MHGPKVLLLLVGDITILYASLFAALLVRYGGLRDAPFVQEHLIPFSIIFALWVLIFFIHGLYDLTAAKNKFEFYSALLRAVGVSFVAAAIFFYFIPFFDITPRRNLFLFLIIFFVLFALWRNIANSTLRRRFAVRTLIVGGAERALPLARILYENPQLGYHVHEVLTFPHRSYQELTHLQEKVVADKVQALIVQKSALGQKRLSDALDVLLEHNVAIFPLEDFEERLTRGVRSEYIDEAWLLEHVAKGRKRIYGLGKRIGDIAAVLVAALPALIIGVLIALAIKLSDRGHLFIVHERVGKNEKPFMLIKFRSMVPNADMQGPSWTVENDPRITRLGRMLRRTRLDEIPQLINILKGEMSFVGPRAEVAALHSLYRSEIPFYEKRYLIKPGLTGWAQINYPYGSSVEDAKAKLAYDFFYLKNRSLVLDIGIILRTIDLILRGSGR
jgi:exopolysaccharide biosynthesis polyprenyl glycosylphosphotransferase